MRLPVLARRDHASKVRGTMHNSKYNDTYPHPPRRVRDRTRLQILCTLALLIHHRYLTFAACALSSIMNELKFVARRRKAASLAACQPAGTALERATAIAQNASRPASPSRTASPPRPPSARLKLSRADPVGNKSPAHRCSTLISRGLLCCSYRAQGRSSRRV